MSKIRKDNSRKCAKCKDSTASNPNLVLHRFPKPGNPSSVVQRMTGWAKYVYPDENWQSTEFQRKLYTSHKMLCSKHFPASAFVEDHAGNIKLHRYCIPSDTDTPLDTDAQKVETQTKIQPSKTTQPGMSVASYTERDNEHNKPEISIYQRILMTGEESLSKLDQKKESGDPGADCIDYFKNRTFQDSAKTGHQQSVTERESFTPINDDDGDHEDITIVDDQGIEHVKEKPELFSWQTNEGIPVPGDDEEILDDNDDQDRFYDDGVRTVTSEETGTEQTVPKDNVLCGYQCNNCKGFINGFLYKCVECFDYDLCDSCETQGVHPLHYVLRIPQSRHNDEIQLAIEIIQRELNLSFSKRRADDDTDSVKLEIKEEPDPIHTEEVCVGDIALSKEIDEGSLDPTKGNKNMMESGEDGEPDAIDTEEVCVGDMSLSEEIGGGSLEGHKNTMESGESIPEHDVDYDMVVEMLEDDNDMIVEVLEDNEEEISSVPLFPRNNDDSEDSDEDTQRTTPPLTRSTNKTRRTVTTDRSPDHSESSHEFSDDDNYDDDDFHLPKRKRTTLCTRSPKIRTLVRPVEASPQLRAKETPPQASGAKELVYLLVRPPKYKLKR